MSNPSYFDLQSAGSFPAKPPPFFATMSTSIITLRGSLRKPPLMLKYWEELALPPSQYPLISVATHIFSVVPHAGVDESTFSVLSRIHTRDRNPLTVSKLKQLVMIKRWTTSTRERKEKGKNFNGEKGKTRQVGDTNRQGDEDYNELDIIGNLEEAVSADEDLVTTLLQELKKAKEEMAEATRLGRESPSPTL
ncbi:hypothetical protein BT69DRAFT_1343866 [Atractiella rhizophila]|nr:hypothetical protein BT69DRAFT_1343866 [Atractiella rhizophila]